MKNLKTILLIILTLLVLFSPFLMPYYVEVMKGWSSQFPTAFVVANAIAGIYMFAWGFGVLLFIIGVGAYFIHKCTS